MATEIKPLFKLRRFLINPRRRQGPGATWCWLEPALPMSISETEALKSPTPIPLHMGSAHTDTKGSYARVPPPSPPSAETRESTQELCYGRYLCVGEHPATASKTDGARLVTPLLPEADILGEELPHSLLSHCICWCMVPG